MHGIKAIVIAAVLLHCGGDYANALCAPPDPPVTMELSSAQFGTVNVWAVTRHKLTALIYTYRGNVTIGQSAIVNPWDGFLVDPVSDLCSGKTFTSDTTCSMEIEFRPTPASFGQRSSRLNIPYSTVSSGTYETSVPLTAVVANTLGADISASPAEIIFDLNTVSDTATRMFELMNVGTDNLVISGMSVTGSGLYNSDPSVFSVSTCTTIEPSGVCRAEIRFTDSPRGSRSAELMIVSNDADEPVISVPLAVWARVGGYDGPCDDTPGVSSVSCFIATAAYGSRLDPHVQVLRDFRDRRLLTNDLGRAFVRWYYSVSPPVAETIARRPALRTATRLALTGAIAVIEYPAVFTAGILGLACLLFLSKRRPAAVHRNMRN